MSKTITISEETYDSIKDQLNIDEKVDISDLHDFVGKKLFIRTVTYHSVGKVEKIVGGYMELSGASWIPDSGQFSNTIKKGEIDEVEVVGQMWINISSIVDKFPWNHDLPIETK